MAFRWLEMVVAFLAILVLGVRLLTIIGEGWEHMRAGRAQEETNHSIAPVLDAGFIFMSVTLFSFSSASGSLVYLLIYAFVSLMAVVGCYLSWGAFSRLGRYLSRRS